MSRKKETPKRIRRVAHREMNMEDRTLSIAFTDGQELTVPFNGLPADVMYRLAMLGAYELLTRATDRTRAWEAIKSGEAFAQKERKYQPIIHVLSELAAVDGKPLPLRETQAKWDALTEQERKELRRSPPVQAKLLEMKSKSLAQQTTNVRALLMREELQEKAA